MKKATRKTGPASVSGHPAEPKAGKPTAGPSAPQQEKKDQELFRFFSCEPPPGSAQERGITRVPSPPTETPVREPIFTFKAEPVQLSAQPEDSSLAPRKKVTDTTTTTVSQTAEVQQKAQKERRKKSVKDKRRKGSTCSEASPSGIKGAALMETDSVEGTRPQADISQYTSSSTMWDDRPPRDWPQEWVLEWELYKKEEKYTAWVWKNRMVEYEAKRHSREGREYPVYEPPPRWHQWSKELQQAALKLRWSKNEAAWSDIQPRVPAEHRHYERWTDQVKYLWPASDLAASEEERKAFEEGHKPCILTCPGEDTSCSTTRRPNIPPMPGTLNQDSVPSNTNPYYQQPPRNWPLEWRLEWELFCQEEKYQWWQYKNANKEWLARTPMDRDDQEQVRYKPPPRWHLWSEELQVAAMKLRWPEDENAWTDRPPPAPFDWGGER